MIFLAIPLVLTAGAVYWLATAHAVPSGDSTVNLAFELIDRCNDGTLWNDAIGGAEGLRELYRSAIQMLGEVSRNPNLPCTRNELVLMAAWLYIATRWCIYIEAPVKSLFPSLPRRAAWTSARLYSCMAATYAAAMEL